MMAIVHGAEEVGFDRDTLDGAQDASFNASDALEGLSRKAWPSMPCEAADDDEHITFLYRLRGGACPRSYGLQVRFILCWYCLFSFRPLCSYPNR